MLIEEEQDEQGTGPGNRNTVQGEGGGGGEQPGKASQESRHPRRGRAEGRHHRQKGWEVGRDGDRAAGARVGRTDVLAWLGKT